jgi:phospholipase/carboxylesterase
MKGIFFIVLLIVIGGLTATAQGTKPEEGLALKYLVQLPLEKTKHTPVIILLHGYGSDEKDLFELRSKFPKKYLVISARAPYPAPNGGYQWYTFTDGRLQAQKDQLGFSRSAIQRFITQITAKYKADPGQVYLVGFSQGAIMSYEAGLTAPGEVKGIAALSGRIDGGIQRGITHKAEVKQLSVFISHGTADDRIKFEEGKAAVDVLKKLGIAPEFHEYKGMGHTISNEVLSDLVKWLNSAGH